MNPIIIPKNEINKPISFYKTYLKKSQVSFLLNLDEIESIIKQIKTKNNYTNSLFIIKNLYYFLYKYIQNNDPTEPLDNNDGGKPKDGFEFFNKNTTNGYGIYHCHLSGIDNSILIWYPIANENGYFLKIKYLIHPENNIGYNKIIKKIYNNNDDGYHIGYYKYFSELDNILSDDTYDINEKIITKFKKFIYKK